MKGEEQEENQVAEGSVAPRKNVEQRPRFRRWYRREGVKRRNMGQDEEEREECDAGKGKQRVVDADDRSAATLKVEYKATLTERGAYRPTASVTGADAGDEEDEVDRRRRTWLLRLRLNRLRRWRGV